ncbi:MAG TPA: GDSL-type esterase/lipase family protein [Xanthobacteraceae bacterium]|nr:GDSL-type esterase/lipase family protein [Xanthobacteraceae bacterium]
MKAMRSTRLALAALGLAGAGVLLTAGVLMPSPAAAQFWGDPFFRPPRPQRAIPQQQMDPFGGLFQPQRPFWQPQRAPRSSPAPTRSQLGDSSKAPPPKKPDTPPTTTIVVLGDAMADWLGHGLEEAYADNPEFGVVRKVRTNSGLIRNESRSDSYDWVQAAREFLASEKPDYVVMMIGLSDRVPIRERPAARAGGKPGQPPAQQGQAQPAQPAQPSQQTPPPQSQQNAAQDAEGATKPESSPEPAPSTTSANHEFRSDKWGELYAKRIDETIAALKAKGVPVVWVGLPPIRGPRSRSDVSYLNDYYRARAQKAGIIYVDVWDGFVDDEGNFNLRGPDYNGQIRQLRSTDGIYFTKAGALKLGHYVEREIQRLMQARATPVALPAPEPQQQTPAKSGVPAARPVAGPVVPLTATTTTPEDLAGSGSARGASSPDPLATRVLLRGESSSAPSGRADDFSWPRAAVDDSAIIPVAVAPPAAPPPQRPSGKKGATDKGASKRSGQSAEKTAPTRQR